MCVFRGQVLILLTGSQCVSLEDMYLYYLLDQCVSLEDRCLYYLLEISVCL